VKLRYADPALVHLEGIFSYIAAENPGAARRVLADLMRAATFLKAAPFAGRPGRAPGTRDGSSGGGLMSLSTASSRKATC